MIEWLQTTVFPEAVEARSFGDDVRKFVSFEPNKQKGTDQFASDVVFGDVTVEKENGQLITESVIIKVQPTFEMAHRIFDCDAQFHNEILFYSKLIPLFRKYDTDNVLSTSFCEFVYGKATNGQNPKEDVIILKSLHEKGFKLTDERVFIDEKHIKLALDRIAKYHALSFKCQAEDPAAFYDIVAKIKKTHREPDDELKKSLLTVSTYRGIDPLQNDPKYKDRLTDIYKHCEKADDWCEKYQSPSEHLNVITHGDFCRNNMMFKYGSNGEPIEVVFFDLATIKYCSPTIDTSFFLFLNTSPETRQLYWDSFLRTYYDSLADQLKSHPAKPSFEDVKLDLRKKGIYGYYLCSFFLAAMVDAKTKENLAESVNLSPEDLIQEIKEEGGPETTEYLAEMVKHMLDKNYIFDH